MDFNWSQDEEDFRQEVRGFLQAELPEGCAKSSASLAELFQQATVANLPVQTFAGGIGLGIPAAKGIRERERSARRAG